MTESIPVDENVGWIELHCPTDGALLLRFKDVSKGFFEGKCRKCKFKHVFEKDEKGEVKHINSYK